MEKTCRCDPLIKNKYKGMCALLHGGGGRESMRKVVPRSHTGWWTRLGPCKV